MKGVREDKIPKVSPPAREQKNPLRDKLRAEYSPPTDTEAGKEIASLGQIAEQFLH